MFGAALVRRALLVVATSTSLNLRAVLKTAVARSGMDVPARTVSGLTASAKALFVAAAAHRLVPEAEADSRDALAASILKSVPVD